MKKTEILNYCLDTYNPLEVNMQKIMKAASCTCQILLAKMVSLATTTS